MSDPVNAPPAKKELKGFGGWLLLLLIGLIVGVIRLLADFAALWPDYEKLWSMPEMRGIAVFEIAINVVLIVLHVGLLVVMLMKLRRFTQLFTWLWLVIIITPIVDALVVMAVAKLPADEVFNADFAKSMFAGLVTGLWVWYARTSVRVKNTFVN